MAKISYDQRLKKRWVQKQQRAKYERVDINHFYDMRSLMNMAGLILPFLFRTGGSR